MIKIKYSEKMRKIKNILVMLALLTSFSIAKSQPSCEITEVLVNSTKINFEEIEELVVRSNDTLTFKYSLKNAQKNETESFYYRVGLSNSTDTSSKVTGYNIAQYVNLAENGYEFIISAFDLRGRWLAKQTSIKFRVDTKEAELISKLEKYREKFVELEANQPNESKLSFNGIDLIPLIIGVVIGIIVASIFLIFYIVLSRKSNNKNKGDQMASDENIIITKEEYNKIMTENSNLRAEIAALRGQIDALQARSTDMKKQNKELQESLNQLTSSKDELEKLQTQKDELFALIIHDIKNPAALIKSLVDLLRSYDLSAVEQQEIINDIAETTSRIVSLSHEVSKILALETTKLVLDIQPGQVSEVVEEVVRRNNVAAITKGIVMTTEISPNLPEAEFDIQKVEEVVDNLVSNAIKFTQNSGKVHVKAFVENKNVTVEVTDNGLGLSESDVRNAFQRGSRLSAQPTSGESSTGLGLWIVKKLVDAHNGRVWVKSTLGKGSTFAFSLPVKHSNEQVEA